MKANSVNMIQIIFTFMKLSALLLMSGNLSSKGQYSSWKKNTHKVFKKFGIECIIFKLIVFKINSISVSFD